MRCKSAGKMERPMSALGWISIAGKAVGAPFFEYILCWLVFFSPGWANGWPFGLSFQAVLSTAITGWISLVLMTASVGAGAIVGFICALLRVGQKHGGQVYRSWLWFASLVILCLSLWIFANIHAWVWKEFPNGYMIP
jgi:hypothetical protein